MLDMKFLCNKSHGFALLNARPFFSFFLPNPFFSPVLVSTKRLWTHGTIKYFYCRLYLYFIVTSFGLSLGFLPFFQRFVRKYLVTEALISTSTLLYWKDLWNLLSLANFAQFCIVSTMVCTILESPWDSRETYLLTWLNWFFCVVLFHCLSF